MRQASSQPARENEMKKNNYANAYIELAVIIIIIAVLAAFAFPKFRASAERSKASEAYHYLRAIRASQERHHIKTGQYASEIANLGIKSSIPKHFNIGKVESGITGSFSDSWLITMTREKASAGYRDYTITFTQDGFLPEESSISDYPAIDPLSSL